MSRRLTPGRRPRGARIRRGKSSHGIVFGLVAAVVGLAIAIPIVLRSGTSAKTEETATPSPSHERPSPPDGGRGAAKVGGAAAAPAPTPDRPLLPFVGYSERDTTDDAARVYLKVLPRGESYLVCLFGQDATPPLVEGRWQVHGCRLQAGLVKSHGGPPAGRQVLLQIDESCPASHVLALVGVVTERPVGFHRIQFAVRAEAQPPAGESFPLEGQIPMQLTSDRRRAADLRIRITRDPALGRFIVRAGEVDASRPTDLLAAVTAVVRGSSAALVEIDPDDAVPYRELAGALAICRQAGVPTVRFPPLLRNPYESR